MINKELRYFEKRFRYLIYDFCLSKQLFEVKEGWIDFTPCKRQIVGDEDGDACDVDSNNSDVNVVDVIIKNRRQDSSESKSKERRDIESQLSFV